jgi:hypothetical protein
MYSHFFLKSCRLCGKNVRHYTQVAYYSATNMLFARQTTKARIHLCTLKKFNTCCFTTATVVKRTRFSVLSCVNCPSCHSPPEATNLGWLVSELTLPWILLCSTYLRSFGPPPKKKNYWLHKCYNYSFPLCQWLSSYQNWFYCAIQLQRVSEAPQYNTRTSTTQNAGVLFFTWVPEQQRVRSVSTVCWAYITNTEKHGKMVYSASVQISRLWDSVRHLYDWPCKDS